MFKKKKKIIYHLDIELDVFFYLLPTIIMITHFHSFRFASVND
jgi:hypothetical protein